MVGWLAPALLVLLLGLPGGGLLCAAPAAAAPATAAEQSLSLLQQADLQRLPPPARQQLLLGVAEQQLAAGQTEPVLPLLVQALRETEPLAPPLRERLRQLQAQLTTPQLFALAAAVAETPNAEFAQLLLAERQSGDKRPVIAVLLPLSGRYAPYGERVRRGIEQARATNPLAGGAVFRFLDSAGDAAVAERLLDALAGEPAVQAVIGPLTSGEATQVTAGAAARNLPMLLLAPREGSTGSAQGIFRLALTNEAQIQGLVGYAVKTLGLRRFAVLAPASRLGARYAELFQAEIARLGGQLAARQDYAPGVVDLREELQKLAVAVRAGGGAEALFLPEDPHKVGQVVPQLGFARLDQLQLLGLAGWHTPELMRLAGPGLDGALLADNFCPERATPPMAAFVTAFRAVEGNDPTPLEAIGFDSAGLLLAMLAEPGVRDRTTLAQALASGRGYPGVTGTLRFAADGQAVPSLCLLQVRAGAFVVLD